MSTHIHGIGHDRPAPSVTTYVVIWALLMVLLALTVAAASIDFAKMHAEWLNFTVALTIAIIKAALVMVFFMHVKYGSRLIWVFAVAAFVWLGIMLVLTFSDYLFRGSLPGAGGI